jgi:hypothetical protein
MADSLRSYAPLKLKILQQLLNNINILCFENWPEAADIQYGDKTREFCIKDA